VAVDVPSGVDGLTGAIAGEAVHATATVTFAARKTGLCFEPGRTRAGAVIVADIGIDVEVGEGEPRLGRIGPEDVRAWWPDPDVDAHKWRAGVLVVGGSEGMTGAPLLVSRAAMRTGAGVVWCAVPGPDAAAQVSGTAAEVIAKPWPATPAGALAGIDESSRAAFERFAAAVVGPGLGTDEVTGLVVRDLVEALAMPLVLDADGLNACSGSLELLRARSAPTVLTPHAGEYERLLGEPVGPDRVGAARRLAAATGCVALLKGPGTVVASPDGEATVNPVDGSWLATAGSGDVLAGIVGGFLARGLAAFEAASAAVLVHGLAADEAGHTGLVAGDLVTALPGTLRRLAREREA
jgi:NAD(P)H-hydrate epimerase